ncbi:MAG TPA: serine protein kinase PrkA [Candidatus Nanoarchaeia archaeon]|nr:serine protein kinase PrkA [Candidatus Nanoarchaeia archaeon]
MVMRGEASLITHLTEVKEGKRRFENAFESISRMIFEPGFEKINVNGKTTFDFNIFRRADKPLIGMYDELNQLVGFIKDGADGGSARERAFILVGEPGNGKTFLVEYLSKEYREFTKTSGNERYTFKFKGLENIAGFDKEAKEIESQTYEDPMILAMNLYQTKDANKEQLSKFGFTDSQVEEFFRNYRPLGACSEYILGKIREKTNGNPQEIINDHIEIVKVPITESLGTLTGKYPAKDKITSSAVDLLGDESIQRMMLLTDTNNPYKFDLRRGALSRVAGGGIHFSDEIYKNKKDLIQVYLGVIQNRAIEVDGYKWPMDAFIIGTSNNAEFAKFQESKEEAPIIDRCDICYVAHNTDYKLQKQLTSYAIGNLKRLKTFGGDNLHVDPLTNYSLSVGTVLTRLPRSDKLTPEEMMNLAAGEVAGEKSLKTLTDLIDDLSSNPDVTKRFGQSGFTHRNLERTKSILTKSPETQEGRCIVAKDAFGALKRVILDCVPEASQRTKYLEDVKTAEILYLGQVKQRIFDAYMDEPEAIVKEVRNYVNMVVALSGDNLPKDKMLNYKDPQTGKIEKIKVDERWINSIEGRIGLKSKEQSASFRSTILKTYAQRMQTDPKYNFMDNTTLVKAITDTRFESDIGTESSLVGALANRTNEENAKVRTRMIETMLNKLGYCPTCADKTIQYFAENARGPKA